MPHKISIFDLMILPLGRVVVVLLVYEVITILYVRNDAEATK